MRNEGIELCNNKGVSILARRETPQWYEVSRGKADPNGKLHMIIDLPNTISKSATLTNVNGAVRFEIEQENIEMFIELLVQARIKMSETKFDNPLVDKLVEIYQEVLEE